MVFFTRERIFLRLSTDLAQLSQNKHRSAPIKLRAFCIKVSLSFFLFLEELSSACSQL